MIRKTEEDYHRLAESRGFKWVGGMLPKNTCCKTWWECGKGHRWKAQHSAISRTGCPYCCGQAKLVIADYHNLAKQKGLKWLGLELPKNNKTSTWWLCDKNHKFKARYNNINNSSGNGCLYCARINRRKTEDDYNNLAKENGFVWIGDKLPASNKIKTLWKCENGHVFMSKYNSVYIGFGCPYCAGLIKKTEKDYHELAESRGFKWVGNILPNNTQTKTQWECTKGHRWEAVYGNIYSGTGCPICKDMVNGVPVSKQQRKLNEMLCGSLNYTEGIYRIDVAIMRNSQKIAVEYDCQYWHQGREKYDTKRDNFLISVGWKVLHIKSSKLVPTRKQFTSAIGYLLKTNNNTHNVCLEDWK